MVDSEGAERRTRAFCLFLRLDISEQEAKASAAKVQKMPWAARSPRYHAENMKSAQASRIVRLHAFRLPHSPSPHSLSPSVFPSALAFVCFRENVAWGKMPFNFPPLPPRPFPEPLSTSLSEPAAYFSRSKAAPQTLQHHHHQQRRSVSHQ
ncbi:hypothetical protein cyc_02128 [Cyclospora cayetanensis]|uniref:Uncharacterized protein n=1 Tax=Cyclospora cayetanensis TaxID=88456 RepID=A0A1D3CWS7_9EIME|nr:hypothetical protein cyc_02128 [Cyclospora cayetanensis]